MACTALRTSLTMLSLTALAAIAAGHRPPQYQILADKYAPAAPEVSEVVAALQLPPEIHVTQHHVVPLPRRAALPAGDAQHQTALLIREGRRAAAQLSAAQPVDSVAASSKGDTSLLSPAMDTLTAPSSVAAMGSPHSLEQDFTIEGTKGKLSCPFSRMREDAADADKAGHPTPHQSAEPICPTMLEEKTQATSRRPSTAPSAAAAAAAAKCPIRFMDQCSPEEIARYVETNKHKIPRSHEVCVRRYQRNEEQIRKLDAKYGNLVSMIEDLSHLHQPMLPSSSAVAENGLGDEEDEDHAPDQEVEADGAARDGHGAGAIERVETWAQTVVASDPEQHASDAEATDAEADRTSHFDRPMKEIRVGESPSRPWGISVPVDPAVYNTAGPPRPESPAAAPVHAQAAPHDMGQGAVTPGGEAAPKKCPFDHTKLGFSAGSPFGQVSARDAADVLGPLGGHVGGTAGRADMVSDRPQTPAKPRVNAPQPPTFMDSFHAFPQMRQDENTRSSRGQEQQTRGMGVGGGTAGQRQSPPQPQPQPQSQPQRQPQPQPQMVFNISGPVFIGYPMEQAVQLMQQLQPGRYL